MWWATELLLRVNAAADLNVLKNGQHEKKLVMKKAGLKSSKAGERRKVANSEWAAGAWLWPFVLAFRGARLEQGLQEASFPAFLWIDCSLEPGSALGADCLNISTPSPEMS